MEAIACSKLQTISSEVTSLVHPDSSENGITKEKVHERLRQITFFRVSLVPKQWTGIFQVSNTWTNLCNNMVEEKAGVEKQNSKKGFEKNEHGVSSWVSDFSARLVFKVSCPTWKIQSFLLLLQSLEQLAIFEH